MNTSLPKSARVVIVGGGIIGCSVAYHLAKHGWKDIVLLERKRLSCGTTWHAAGLVRSMLYTINLTKLAQYTADLYFNLETETGQATGYKRNGSISIANNSERWEEILRGASMASAYGIQVEVMVPEDIKKKWPLLYIDDLVGGLWYPEDGQTNPSDTCAALARGARINGVQIMEDTLVTGIRVEGRRAVAVETPHGEISAEVVVNSAGLWGREVGKMAGGNVPLHAAEHFYVVTEPIPNLSSDLPSLRDMDGGAYYKEDAGKLLIGGFELDAKPWGMNGIPDDFCFDQLPDDWEHFSPILEGAMHRVPTLHEIGIRTFFNGPESFTPDQRYNLGLAPELDNFFVAAGFNSIGIQSAGGAGKALAEWIVEGEPPFDLWDVDVRRVMPHQGNKFYLYSRVSEALGLMYAMHWPHRQYETARGLRTSPLHEQLEDLGACFGEVAGWERPNWYSTDDNLPRYEYSFQRQNWFSNCETECKAVREACGFFDLSSFSKFMVIGPDAVDMLQHICTNDIDVSPGVAVYTQWLNEKGGIEADLTVTRLSMDRFMIISSAATSVRDWAWLSRHSANTDVVINDCTSAYAVIGLMGPKSRELLSLLTDTPLDNATFPFRCSKEIEIFGSKVRATRLSYVGELGWELYIPTEFSRGVLSRILDCRNTVPLVPAGMHALDCLRMEKAYRHWGHDITPDDTPLEAGLDFACSFDKPQQFIGRESLLRQRDNTVLSKRLVQFALDDPKPLLYHDEPIYRNGEMVGYITSGAYGHILGSAVGLGYVTHGHGVSDDFILSGSYEIEVAWKRYTARASLTSMYDPKNRNMRL